MLSIFAELKLSPNLLRALADLGYETPTPIQAECIPLLLGGHDLLGQAQTGTGKTAAFTLPMLERIDVGKRVTQALILTPTRELALQVAEACQSYARYLTGFHVVPIYGGQSMGLQLKQLARGAHVVIGTPGRVMDHLERKSLNLSNLAMLVLDEADEMLRMGFIEDVEWILQHLPVKRQTALFSATMPDAIRRVAQNYLDHPHEVKIKSSTASVAAIRQRYCQVGGSHKLDALTRILEVEEDLDAALIFVRTKTATVELAEKLEARGYDVAALNGDMNQVLRERAIEQLKNGDIDLVIATDVAARGIDVSRISHVINYDIPYDTEAYVHRIGRTGRAGRQGTAILFVAPREMKMLRVIERATRQPIEALVLPSKKAVADRRLAQFKEQVMTVVSDEDLSFFSSVIDGLVIETDADINEIAAALAFLVQQERPLQAEGLSEPPPPVPERGRSPHGERRSAEKRDSHHQLTGVMKRYRVEVGRNHGASVGDIVGAIANEAGIDSRAIGRIALFNEYSTVELAGNLPSEILRLLKTAYVRGKPLDIVPLSVKPRASPSRKPPHKSSATAGAVATKERKRRK